MLPFSKILVLGKNGQLASSLRHHDLKKQINYLGQDDINIHDFSSVTKAINKINPELIINCMAYTKVDQAETDKDFCKLLNANFPYFLGQWCEKSRKKLIHFSTDYVFDGTKTSPYLETDKKNPLNIYGKTKSEGEDLLMSLNAEIIIFRISWVYSPYGNNFLKTMLRLGAEKESLKIVGDQIGAPCSALDVARQLLNWIESDHFSKFKKGIYHLTPQGVAISWFEFAQRIFAEASKLDLLLKIKQVLPITTAEYPTPATRPKNSVMDSGKAKTELGIELGDVAKSLKEITFELKQN